MQIEIEGLKKVKKNWNILTIFIFFQSQAHFASAQP